MFGAKELTGEYQLHPDYYRPTILGEFPERISMCRALIQELQVINDMAVAIGREPLFRNDFRDHRANVPKEFCLLIRPTCREFNNFIHVLDKLLSENINRRFFGTGRLIRRGNRTKRWADSGAAKRER